MGTVIKREYCFFGEWNDKLNDYVYKRKLLACTSRKARIELGRTMDNIRCTRSIWVDADGNEYVRHKKFTEPLTLDYLSGHGYVTRL